MITTKKTGSRGWNSGKHFVGMNLLSRSPARRQVTLLGNCVYRREGGGIKRDLTHGQCYNNKRSIYIV